MKESEILKQISSHPLLDIVKIDSPYLPSPVPFKGYYHNKNTGYYFYGPDQIGFGMRLHYGCLIVEDLFGNKFPIVTHKSQGDFELSLRIDPELYSSLDLTPQVPDYPLYIMTVDPAMSKPGLLFREDECSDFEVILNSYSTEGLFLYHLITLSRFGEVNHHSNESFKDQIYTLVPFQTNAGEGE